MDSYNSGTVTYIQNQQRLELGTNKYRQIIHKVNTETKIDDKTIKEIESTSSLFNSKTVNYDKFREYLIEKNKVNNKLFNYYQQKFFRKFKLNSFPFHDSSEVFIFLEAKLTLTNIPKFL